MDTEVTINKFYFVIKKEKVPALKVNSNPISISSSKEPQDQMGARAHEAL